jgi:galactarate dehydratase
MTQEPEMQDFVTGTATAQAYEPRYIRLDPNDNVAIVVNDLGLPAKTRFACGLELRSFVPQGHKVALSDIAEGAAIRRYNEVIGTAARPILAGEWVDEARIQMPTPPELDKLELATAVPAPQASLEGYTFEGFRNPDGSVGTKNVLAISTSVQCVAGTLQFAIKRIKAELLPKYPGVDDVVGLTHNYGCGVAITAPLAIVPIRTLQNLALNPNFGGEVMVVGLGCEKLVPERLLPEGADNSIVRMQDEAFDGFGAIVDAIMAMADARLCRAQPAPPRNLPRFRPRRRPAMRRLRCVFRRDRQSRAGLRRRFAGARRCRRDVFRSHGGARRHSSVDAPRRHRGRRPRAHSRNGLV